MTSKEQVRAWKDSKIAEGWCANCFKRMAGSENGTWRFCGPCADYKIAYGRKKAIEKKGGPLRQYRIHFRTANASPRSKGLPCKPVTAVSSVDRKLDLIEKIESLRKAAGA